MHTQVNVGTRSRIAAAPTSMRLRQFLLVSFHPLAQTESNYFSSLPYCCFDMEEGIETMQNTLRPRTITTALRRLLVLPRGFGSRIFGVQCCIRGK